MWDPVVSGAFWKQHPGCPVRSCRLLPSFKAWAKPLVAAGWVISSWAGTGCIGRAPSPWGKQFHPPCLPHAGHLLRMLANWISRAVPLGSTVFAFRGRTSLWQIRGWLLVGGTALRSCSGISMDVGGPCWSSPLLFSHPRRKTAALLKLKRGVQENSFFFPLCKKLVWSCCNQNRGEEIGLICMSSAIVVLISVASSKPVPRGYCAGVLLRHLHAISVPFAFRALLPQAWSCSAIFSPIFSVHATHNSNAGSWNDRQDEYCLLSEPARRFLCYWFACMCQSPSSGLLSSLRSWSVSPCVWHCYHCV